MNTITQLITSAKAVIFDMDGLIIDSEPVWKMARQAILAKRNIHLNTSSKSETMGMGLKEAVIVHKEKYNLTEPVEQLMQEYRDTLYGILLKKENLLVMEGVKEFVREVSKQKKKLAIATGGHTVATVKKILELLSLDRYFPVIASCDEVERGKPYPDVYLLAAKRLGVDPIDCIVIEDAVNGTKAGKAAGMKVIGVNSDVEWRRHLEEAGADAVVKSVKKILA